MTYGIHVRNPSGGLIFDSNTSSSVYFHDRLDVAAAYTEAPATPGDSIASIFVPSVRPVFFDGGWGANNDGSTAARQFYHFPGYCIPNSSTVDFNYRLPVRTMKSLRTPSRIELYPGQVDLQGFIRRNQFYTTPYGVKTVGLDGKARIHEGSANLKVQTDISGNYLFTATASTIATTHLGAPVPPFEFEYTPGYVEVPQTITFPKSLDNPPLIFITNTESSYPSDYNYGISLFKFIKDIGTGKYVGACIVCPAAPAFVATNPFIGPDDLYRYNTPRTPIDFTYYLVSEEDPLFSESNTHGIVVKDATGNVLFGSQYIHPGLDIYVKNCPERTYFPGNLNQCTDFDYSSYPSTPRTTGNPDPYFRKGTAVCLNNFPAFNRIEEKKLPNPGQPSILNIMGLYLSMPTVPDDRIEVKYDVTWSYDTAMPYSTGGATFSRIEHYTFGNDVINMLIASIG